MRRSRFGALLLFLCVYLGAATVVQAVGARQLGASGAPLEFFSAGLLVMLCLLALLLAVRQWPARLRTLFWVVGAGALAVLAVDEVMEIHERAGKAAMGGDDAIKVLLWLGSAGVLAIVLKWYGRSAPVALFFIVGYLLQSFYILVEVGDGDVFSLPLSIKGLRSLEEIVEMSFLTAYLIGFAKLWDEQRYDHTFRQRKKTE